MSSPSRGSVRRGVTLIDLVVVLVILALLLALLLPAVLQVRDAAARTANANNLKQLALACHSIADTKEGVLPPVYIESWVDPNAGHLYGGSYAPKNTGTVFFFLLPYIEQEGLFRQSKHPDANVGYSVYHNNVHTNQIKTFQSTLDETAKEKTHGWGVTSFACNYQVFGRPGHPWGGAWGCTGALILAGMKDGTSNTVFFAEKRAACRGGPSGSNGNLWAHGWWNADWMPTFGNSDAYGVNAWLIPQLTPTNNDCEPYRATAFAATGCQVGMADGSVRLVAPSITQATWNAVLTPNGREFLGRDWDGAEAPNVRPHARAAVKGKVTVGGKEPLTGGAIQFVLASDPKIKGSGMIKADGTYEVTDAPVGECKVVIDNRYLAPKGSTGPVIPGGPPASGPPKDKKTTEPPKGVEALPGDGGVNKYIKIDASHADPDKTPLKSTVSSRAASPNDFDVK